MTRKQLHWLHIDVFVYFFFQVQMLLNEKRVNEALQLAHVAMETVNGPQRDEKVLEYIVKYLP